MVNDERAFVQIEVIPAKPIKRLPKPCLCGGFSRRTDGFSAAVQKAGGGAFDTRLREMSVRVVAADHDHDFEKHCVTWLVCL